MLEVWIELKEQVKIVEMESIENQPFELSTRSEFIHRQGVVVRE